MQIQINGKPKVLPAETSIVALLQQLQLKTEHVVVERNSGIVAKENYATTLLAEGDALEIVQFVGGG